MKIHSSSLADAILATDEALIDVLGLRGARDALRLPWDHLVSDGKNHISPPHAALADVFGAEAMNEFAKPFKVDPEVANVIWAMMGKNDLEQATIVIENARLPCPNGWLEFVLANTTIGILWAQKRNEVIADVYQFDVENEPFYALRIVNVLGKEVRSDATHILGRVCKAAGYPEELTRVVGRFFVSFCAFVTLPRACETHWQISSRQIARSRRRAGLMPLLSFNEVSFAPLRNDGSQSHRHGDCPGVRLHDVIAHWRRVVRAGKESLVFVNAHQRGDARKGIVLKKRHLAA